MFKFVNKLKPGTTTATSQSRGNDCSDDEHEFPWTGIEGPRGKRGHNGMDGCPGEIGATGPEGRRGRTGRQGRDGLNGLPGEVGPSGARGLIGASGVGVSGATGASGISGLQGVSGVSGIGVSGMIGATGCRGSRGHSGRRGKRGYDGNDGCDGKNGKIGATGISGASGIQGATGASGIGVSGLQGATGASGQIASAFGSFAVVNQIQGIPVTQAVGWIFAYPPASGVTLPGGPGTSAIRIQNPGKYEIVLGLAAVAPTQFQLFLNVVNPITNTAMWYSGGIMQSMSTIIDIVSSNTDLYVINIGPNNTTLQASGSGGQGIQATITIVKLA